MSLADWLWLLVRVVIVGAALAGLLMLMLTSLLVAIETLVDKYGDVKDEQVQTWQEWQHARQWDRYPRNPDVDVRPLDKK